MLDVSAGGKCTYYSMKGMATRTWDVYEYVTDADTVLSIKRYTAGLDLPSRPHLTSAGVHDGSQWYATVWIDGRSVNFWCDNSFPWFVVALSGRLKSCLPPPGAVPKRTIDNMNEFYEEMARIGAGGISGIEP